MRNFFFVTLAVLASCGCGFDGGVTAPPTFGGVPARVLDFSMDPLSIAGASPLRVDKTRPVGPGLICAFSLTTSVKGFPGGNVITSIGEPAPCPAPVVEWTLLSNPDGVTYTTHLTYEDLLVGIPAPPGAGSRFLRLHSWIHNNGVCMAAYAPTLGLTRKGGMVGTSDEKCEELA